MDEFILENENKNTAIKTKLDLKVLNDFLATRFVIMDIEDIEPAQLNKHLADFFINIRQKNGDEYQPTSLRSFFGSFQRHLKLHGYKHCILTDPLFAKCRAAMVSKQKCVWHKSVSYRSYIPETPLGMRYISYVMVSFLYRFYPSGIYTSPLGPYGPSGRCIYIPQDKTYIKNLPVHNPYVITRRSGYYRINTKINSSHFKC